MWYSGLLHTPFGGPSVNKLCFMLFQGNNEMPWKSHALHSLWSRGCCFMACTSNNLPSIASDLASKLSAIRRLIMIHCWLKVTAARRCAGNHGQSRHEWSTNFSPSSQLQSNAGAWSSVWGNDGNTTVVSFSRLISTNTASRRQTWALVHLINMMDYLIATEPNRAMVDSPKSEHHPTTLIPLWR